jgi:hypothetical protein
MNSSKFPNLPKLGEIQEPRPRLHEPMSGNGTKNTEQGERTPAQPPPVHDEDKSREAKHSQRSQPQSGPNGQQGSGVP